MTAKTVDVVGAGPEHLGPYPPTAARTAIKIPTPLAHQERSLSLTAHLPFEKCYCGAARTSGAGYVGIPPGDPRERRNPPVGPRAFAFLCMTANIFLQTLVLRRWHFAILARNPAESGTRSHGCEPSLMLNNAQ